ncbi:hypothetical protein HGRIS_010044 [Hohenbuehelia grisea]|uniref:PX domain-containing protein n=1 Tax=Hohenbuehelia grisea TaxID=104357 RepID=A0ABR3J3M8_9AGAR
MTDLAAAIYGIARLILAFVMQPAVTQPPARPQRPTRSIPPPPIDTALGGEQNPVSDVQFVSESPQTAQTEQAENNAADLTPLRAHYLKKSLIQLQFNQELDSLTSTTPNNVSTFSFLGSPFSPPPKDAPPLDLPFLKYIFRQFVLTFPFMAAAPKDFYSEKLQPFMGAMLSRNFSPNSVLDEGPEATEHATRMKLLGKLERNLSMFLGGATKLVEREEVVRLNQSDLDRLERISKKRQARLAKHREIFEVNIVSVRTVIDKGRVRSRAHEEFIIRTRRTNYPDIFVSRRYGDFKTLANELRKAHPEEEVKLPPVKDRTTVTAPTVSSPMAGSYPPSPSPSQSSHRSFASGSQDSFQSMPASPSLNSPQFSQLPNTSRLAREKNRLTLRAYLHSLMTSRSIASSPVLKSFLLSGPTKLSPNELEDARRREEADNVREDGRKRFAREIAARVDGLRQAVKDVKGDIMGANGLTHVFGTIKVTPNVTDLPQNYQAVLEWARISLASTVFQQFLASDTSSETFASLKRIHGLMPYMLMRGALKISNPIGMIRGILDLFLAQPFGGRSLLQRMFTSSLTEEVKALEEQIEAVKEKVEDPVMCEKIRRYVYAPREIQDMYKLDAASEQMNLITIILRSAEEPVLSRAQMHRVARAHQAHAAYTRYRDTLDDSDDDDGPQDEEAWLHEDLRILAHLYARLHDREQLIALVFEGFTADLLKDIITIFYSPLAQVYKAASIADSLSDLQTFINDLIKTVEAVGDLSQEDPHRTVQTFINLIQRHEQAFYSFVHKVHSKGEGLFDSLMRWIELFLTVIREGLGQPISLEFLLPHKGPEREEILKEVDQVALYHYKLKVMHEDKLRRRFGRAQSGKEADADAEDEATQVLVDSVVGEISFGELIQGDADELAAADSDEEDDDSEEDSSEYETATSDSGSSDSSNESEDSAVEQRTPRSTIAPGRSPLRQQQQNPLPPLPPQRRSSSSTPHQRTLSLRSPRSIPSLRASDAATRRSHDSAPPVPPLPPLPPKNQHTLALSKPLPPSPAQASSSSARTPRTPYSPSPTSASRNKTPTTPGSSRLPQPPAMGTSAKSQKAKPKAKGKAKNGAAALQAPELQHIPRLLPIFIEMMRDQLRLRQRTM